MHRVAKTKSIGLRIKDAALEASRISLCDRLAGRPARVQPIKAHTTNHLKAIGKGRLRQQGQGSHQQTQRGEKRVHARGRVHGKLLARTITLKNASECVHTLVKDIHAAAAGQVLASLNREATTFK